LLKASRLAPGVALEEAGIAYRVFRIMDCVMDYCKPRHTFCITLVSEVLGNLMYGEALRECFYHLIFNLHLPCTLEESIRSALGRETPTRTRSAFCTVPGLRHMRLSLVSHLNRCLDLCRMTIRKVRRDQGTGRLNEDLKVRMTMMMMMIRMIRMRMMMMMMMRRRRRRRRMMMMMMMMTKILMMVGLPSLFSSRCGSPGSRPSSAG
jgi:hypothetical protein